MDIFEVSGASERQATFSIIYQPHQKHKSAMRAVCGSDGHVLMSNQKICDCEWQETYFFRRSGKFRGRNGRWRGERHSGKHSDDSVQASHQPTSSHRHLPTQRQHDRPLARWASIPWSHSFWNSIRQHWTLNHAGYSRLLACFHEDWWPANTCVLESAAVGRW